MKKILSVFLLVLAAFGLFACKSQEGNSKEPSAESDWHNTIEYEGSFFVNEKLKVLYALDRGVITLWDNGGNGEVMQTVKYDTSVADAIERIEKKDINADGNCDIRIIYSEDEKGARYTLFLWSDVVKGFVECTPYKEITDPVHDSEAGTVTGVWDKGAFGTVTKMFAFNESSGMDIMSTTVSDPEGTAILIAGSFSEGEPAAYDWKPVINGEECVYSYACVVGGEPVTYIAGTEDSDWYIDIGALGFFRPVLEANDGSIYVGEYMEEAQTAVELAAVMKGAGSAYITGMIDGTVNGNEAYMYTVVTDKGDTVYAAYDSMGFWYYSENGETFVKVLTSTGEIIGEGESEFAVAEEEQ